MLVVRRGICFRNIADYVVIGLLIYYKLDKYCATK